ncbi:MAG: UbiH/UbiF/VisC/COQ6 family ubiquinone biosynthesis hydroxylase [Cellvibrionaceae bacterium]
MAEEYDILIVGGGLAGSAMACALVQKLPPEISIGILESQLQLPEYTDSFDPRVVALTASSREFLQSLGVWEKLSRPSVFKHMTVWDADGTGQIEYDGSLLAGGALSAEESSLGHIVENSNLVCALRNKLHESNRVSWLAPERLEKIQQLPSGQWQVNCESGCEVLAGLVVAADGARSPVREQAGFELRQWSYDQSAIVTTVKTEKPHNKTAWQSFLSTGPLAFLPLDDGNGDQSHCSIVWSADTDEAERLMALSDSDFCLALERGLEGRLGRILEVDTRYCLPLRQRHSVRYIKPGVVLVADAAHNIHPLAGQGINLGFLDVEALADTLAWAADRGLHLGSMDCLQRYERQRMSHNLSMMAAMEAFKRVFGSGNLAVRWLRNFGLKLVDKQPLLKQFFVRQSMSR